MKTDKFTLFVNCNILVLLSTTVCNQNINMKENVNIADQNHTDYAFSVGIPILNQRIIYKYDIEFVTEFPSLLGHPVSLNSLISEMGVCTLT